MLALLLGSGPLPGGLSEVTGSALAWVDSARPGICLSEPGLEFVLWGDKAPLTGWAQWKHALQAPVTWCAVRGQGQETAHEKPRS